MMMAAYASGYSGSSSDKGSYNVQLDKDRFYNGILTGPTADAEFKPSLKVTFSAPLTAE
jgi:hypothetical protein